MNRESVVVASGGFWSEADHGRPIVFHARGAHGGTRCRPTLATLPCGHAMPRSVAEKIAEPCRMCYR